jgi:hypothetical protein
LIAITDLLHTPVEFVDFFSKFGPTTLDADQNAQRFGNSKLLVFVDM